MELSEQALPIDEGWLPVGSDEVNEKKLNSIYNDTIKRMAGAYLKVLDKQGVNPLHTENRMPKLKDIKERDLENYSVGDYISHRLFAE